MTEERKIKKQRQQLLFLLLLLYITTIIIYYSLLLYVAACSDHIRNTVCSSAITAELWCIYIHTWYYTFRFSCKSQVYSVYCVPIYIITSYCLPTIPTHINYRLLAIAVWRAFYPPQSFVLPGGVEKKGARKKCWTLNQSHVYGSHRRVYNI